MGISRLMMEEIGRMGENDVRDSKFGGFLGRLFLPLARVSSLKTDESTRENERGRRSRD